MSQGRQNAHSGVHAREQIGHRHAYFLGAAAQVIALTGHTHQATNALNGVVVSCAIAVGTGLSKPRHAAINKAWIEDFQAVIVEPIPGHIADLEVFNEDVAVHHQFSNEGLACGL